MNTFQKPISKLSRNLFPVCLNCQSCRQYLPKDESMAIYCRAGGGPWPLESGSSCPKHKVRKISSDPIAMEDGALRNLLLDLASTIACTLINEKVSPQASGALKKAKAGCADLLNDSLGDVSEITLVSSLERSEVLEVISKALEVLESLKLGAVIEDASRADLAAIGHRLEEWYLA